MPRHQRVPTNQPLLQPQPPTNRHQHQHIIHPHLMVQPQPPLPLPPHRTGPSQLTQCQNKSTSSPMMRTTTLLRPSQCRQSSTIHAHTTTLKSTGQHRAYLTSTSFSVSGRCHNCSSVQEVSSGARRSPHVILNTRDLTQRLNMTSDHTILTIQLQRLHHIFQHQPHHHMFQPQHQLTTVSPDTRHWAT